MSTKKIRPKLPEIKKSPDLSLDTNLLGGEFEDSVTESSEDVSDVGGETFLESPLETQLSEAVFVTTVVDVSDELANSRYKTWLRDRRSLVNNESLGYSEPLFDREVYKTKYEWVSAVIEHWETQFEPLILFPWILANRYYPNTYERQRYAEWFNVVNRKESKSR